MIETIAVGTVIALIVMAERYRRLARLCQAHASALALTREEIARARADGADASNQALREAAEAQAATLLSGVRGYHDQVQSNLRAQIASAEVRARTAERAATDMTTALEAATGLVRELRELLDDRCAKAPLAVRRVRTILDEPTPDSDARATIDMPRPHTLDDEPEEELTQVAKRPVAGTSGAPNGLRIASSRLVTPPSIAPPGSATMLPPEPAQVAAGLGPRPISKPLAASSTPHPRPVRVGALVAMGEAPKATARPSRAATLLGIAAPASRTQPAASSADDDELWAHVERMGEVDGARPRVDGPRAPRAPLGTAPTLPSMHAVNVGGGDDDLPA